MSAFVTAFDNLDWQAFRTCFGSIATIFHPAAPNIKLIDSPDQFEKAWCGVFERIKKSSGRASPPYISLHPFDLSENVALVILNLVNGGTVNRRTLDFKREPFGCKSFIFTPRISPHHSKTCLRTIGHSTSPIWAART